MLVTTLNVFRAATAKDGKPFARGGNLIKVDNALEAYWLSINGGDGRTEIGLLTGLVDACKTWLKLKYHKSEMKKNFLGMETNYYKQLFMTRRTEVTRLGNEALDELQACLQLQGILTPDLRGVFKFDKQKLQALGTRRTFRKDLRPMGQDYQPERGSYLQSGKVRAISGSGVHSVHQFIHDKYHSGRIEDIQGMTPRGLKSGLKDISKLTVEDFRILDEIGRENILTGDVNYLTKRERIRLMAIPDGQGCLVDYQDQLITTHEYKVTAYTMDRYGNLLCKDADPMGGAYFFNHSSFNAGQDVICAGTLTIDKGVLTSIDNNSGHYKPTRDNLFNCVDVLVTEGVNISRSIVNCYLFVGGVKQEHRFNATTFHGSKTAVADISIT